MQKVQVTIDKNGEIKMEAIGAVGKECETWTAGLERILSSKATITGDGKKPEYTMTKGKSNVNSRA